MGCASLGVAETAGALNRGICTVRKPLAVGDVTRGELTVEVEYVAAGSIHNASPATPSTDVGETHALRTKTQPLFRLCAICNQVCWGVALQAYECSDCHLVFHRECVNQAPTMACNAATSTIDHDMPMSPSRDVSSPMDNGLMSSSTGTALNSITNSPMTRANKKMAKFELL